MACVRGATLVKWLLSWAIFLPPPSPPPVIVRAGFYQGRHWLTGCNFEEVEPSAGSHWSVIDTKLMSLDMRLGVTPQRHQSAATRTGPLWDRPSGRHPGSRCTPWLPRRTEERGGGRKSWHGCTSASFSPSSLSRACSACAFGSEQI